jgi:hypothetical protein
MILDQKMIRGAIRLGAEKAAGTGLTDTCRLFKTTMDRRLFLLAAP